MLGFYETVDSRQGSSQTNLPDGQHNEAALIKNVAVTNTAAAKTAAWVERFALSENLALIEHITLASNINPFANDISFNNVIQMLINALSIPFLDAVGKLVSMLDNHELCDTLMRTDTTLRNVCEIASVDIRSRAAAVLVFDKKYAGHSDFTDELNQWNPMQIEWFFSTFGACLVSLDVRRVSDPSFILHCIRRFCTSLTELKCIISSRSNAHEMRPLFSHLQKLHISDCSIELCGSSLFTSMASIEYLTFERCTNYTLPLTSQMPRLVKVVELPIKRQQRNSYRCKTKLISSWKIGMKMCGNNNWTMRRQSGFLKVQRERTYF